MVASPPNLETRIRRFQWFQVLWSFELWHPFWTLWLFAHSTFFEATLVDVVFWTVSLLMAMPAGALADRYGRKPALLAGIVMWNVGVVLFGLAGSLPIFAIANSVWAFGAAFLFSSGYAYLYDVLAEAGQEARYPKEVSRVTLYSFLSTALGSLIGGAVVQLSGSFQVTLLLNALTGLFAVGAALTFREPAVHRMPSENLFAQIRSGLRTTRRNRQIALLIVFQVLVGVVTYIMAFFRPEFIGNLVQGDYVLMGAVFAGFFAVAAVAGRSVEPILNRIGEAGSLLLTFLLVYPPFAIVYAVSAGTFSAGMALLLGVVAQASFYIIWGFENPIITTIINRRVLASDRATVLSISVFFTTLALAGMEPLV